MTHRAGHHHHTTITTLSVFHCWTKALAFCSHFLWSFASHLHEKTSQNFIDFISPSFKWSNLPLKPNLGVQSVNVSLFIYLLSCSLTTRPAHLYLIFFTVSITSLSSILSLIHSFVFISLGLRPLEYFHVSLCYL